MTVVTPKKIFPNACTKEKLYEMYCLDMSRRQIRNGINAIIKANRGLPKFHQVSIKQIAPSELQEFREIYGMPRGYELPK